MNTINSKGRVIMKQINQNSPLLQGTTETIVNGTADRTARKPLLLQLIVGLLLAIGNLPYAVIGIMEAYQNGSIEFMQIVHVFVVLAGVLNVIVYFRTKKKYEEACKNE